LNDRDTLLLDRDSIAAAALMTEPYEPCTYEDSKTYTYWTQWKNAMDDEVKSLLFNKTWRLKKRSSVAADGKRVLRGKWISKIKRAEDGSVQTIKRDG
jgi:hypothetical protein